MIIVNVQECPSIEQALKIFKNKISKTNLVKDLRERQAFTKPSVKRRKEILGARYREKIVKGSEN
jgi:small subunit ribosomal protein S21